MTAQGRPRLVMAGTHSGCGKTTATLAVLGALKARGTRCVSFKCGPDYIDPLFHTRVLGVPCRNLDLFLCGEQTVAALLDRNHPPGSTAVVEGGMGFYDGVFQSGRASTCHLSRITGTPVVLVADARGRALSLAAEIRGFLSFQPNQIRAVLLNNVSERSYPMYRSLVEEHCGVPVAGYLPRMPDAALESRHLGLVTAAEVGGLREKLAALARQAAATVDLDLLEALAAEAGEVRADAGPEEFQGERVPVAVARDDAFCFYYADTLDALEDLGAELLEFSPLAGQPVPEEACGLLLGGGYPELYGESLSANTQLLHSLGRVGEGLPTIAECGGFMLLGRSLRTGDRTYPMACILDISFVMASSAGRFGYVTMRARKDNLLCRTGEEIAAHEFHYSRASDGGGGFEAIKANGDRWDAAFSTDTLYAGYPHLHLAGNIPAARRFLDRCRCYQKERN